jgi:diguanylate cyclase (GGDEF)-like protein
MNPQQYDELTGLEKRESILGKIKTLISEKEKFHIIFADIDFFKSINDNFGHKRGDEIIKGIADFLKEIVGSEGRISRWGGDEFLILLSQNPQIFTEKIGELLLSKKFKGEPELSISLSFGIASYPDDGKNFEELYDAADKRMYDFKKRRRWKGRIVDRKEELSRIREYIVRVMKGDSLLLNIYGEKGCGKTRIIQESSIYAQIVGFDVRIIDGKKKKE